jgi:hypothetical protein
MLFGWRKQYCETLGFAAPASTPMGFTPVAIAGQAILRHWRGLSMGGWNEPAPCRALKIAEFSVIEARLSCELA